jgi:hypothetical protein
MNSKFILIFIFTNPASSYDVTEARYAWMELLKARAPFP